MTDQEHAHLVFQISALERMATWLAAQEIMRSGDATANLRKLSDSLHSLLDENRASAQFLEQMKEHVGARLDLLVEATANEVRRAKADPNLR